MQTITFNTTRCYTAEGQIITARYDHTTGTVTFTDHSRMIDGAYSVTRPFVCETPPPVILAADVMAHYDDGEYELAAPCQLARLDSVETIRL